MKEKCFGKYCCCKCLHQRTVQCHPCNTTGKGSISEIFGYVCFGLRACEGEGTLIFFDRKHGVGCELFEDRKNKKKELLE
jgi:hypothetical protein